MGASLSIDETSLSKGELYTIISNKSARGRKGTIVAIVKGTKINDVVKVVKTLPVEMRQMVLSPVITATSKQDKTIPLPLHSFLDKPSAKADFWVEINTPDC